MQITFENVSADYISGPIRTPDVLNTVNLTINTGTFTAIIGHTGAGKTSLLKAMNGLLIPTTGKVRIGNYTITSETNKQTFKKIRKQVGMVFQFPESQLFAETVEKDICFGPLNFGVSLNEAKRIAQNMIKQVGLDQSILDQSPFSLSGGQKRRVAIAGVLATKPNILVLDEPGAGLDPKGKAEILTLLSELHHKHHITIILVTHDMNDVALYAEDAVVMADGQVVMHKPVHEVFSDQERLASWSLDLPDALRLQLKIEKESGIKLPTNCLTIDELVDTLRKVGLV